MRPLLSLIMCLPIVATAAQPVTEPLFELPVEGFDVVALADKLVDAGWTTFQDAPDEFGAYHGDGVGTELVVYSFADGRLREMFYSYDLHVRGHSEAHRLKERAQRIFDHLSELWGPGEDWEDAEHNYYRAWPEHSPDSGVAVYQETAERGQRLEVELYFGD
ncbi:MAG: hypothetical protein GF399_07305 [Candidatus Coatesbacteria bacterium]|nr:hypothetical protein [Candidatus Coatesbacteria bacterium]